MTILDEIQAAEKKVGVLLTAHHIVLYLVLAAALAFGIYAIESKVASLQEARAQAAETALAVEKDRSAQLAAVYAANEAQRQAERAQALIAVTQIQSQAKVQIIQDKTLPVKDAGHRIEDLTGFKQGTVLFDTSDNLIVPLPLGREIVVRLDQEAADAKTVIAQESVIKSQASTITDQAGIIAEDKVVLTKQIKADGEELKKAKDDARKRKLKWFGAGVVAGFVGRQFVHFGL